MGKLKILTGIIVSVTILTLGWAGLASAHSFRSGTNVTVGQAQTIEHSLFATGRTIDIAGEVSGDILCAGQTITISGTVHGDVICAGQTINISGEIDGDLRLAAQNVTVGASVSGNATIAGQTFTLESTGTIEGDVTVGSSDATFNGTVGRDIAAGGETVIIANSVGRDIEASVTNLRLQSGANIAGDITYTSNNRLDQARGAAVGGEITRNEPSQSTSSKRGAVFGFSILWFLYWFVAMLLTALALVFLFPRVFQVVTNRAVPRPWKALLTGFVASFAVPLLFVLLAVTVIGLPLAFIIGLLWFVVLLLSGPFFGFYLGRLVLRTPGHPVLTMFVGAGLLLILYFIPIIGFIALLAALWIGTGMLLLEAFSRTPRPAYAAASTAAVPPAPKPTTKKRPQP